MTTDFAATDPATTEDLIPAERQQRLVHWFRDNQSGSNQDLARMLNTSVSTIRRDLDTLAAQGLVRRTHGGAVSVRRMTTWEPTVVEAQKTAVEEKRAIALEAARRLEPGQSILLDTGSMLYEFAQVIAGMTLPLTIVTNDVHIASTLSRTSHLRLIVPGGTCRPRANALLGEPGLSFLKELRCDRLFFSVQAIDQECLSDTYLDLVQLKLAMMASARASTLLIDSSRFDARALHRVCGLETLDEIITDEGLAESEARSYGDLGIAITRVSVGSAAD
ncbi:DeoR/GlpR family DNA-binding transcription regulator [Frigidibacter sp. MR17.14]|uniref:DeoR/GlpR family DNA-binding transcription regulator n=1 Tax=Frigidibacter sp. MR17.14 TaxID=3126509 RepID=UPI003012CB90